MMKLRIFNTPLFYAVLLLLALLFFLIIKLPAKLVYSFIPATNMPVQLSDIQGSIWSGQAGTVRLPNLELQNLAWQVSIAPLFSGVADLHWQINDPAIKAAGQVAVTEQQITLSNLKATADIAELSAPYLPQGIQLLGELAVDISSDIIKQNALSALDGMLTVQQAAVSERAYVALGDFTARLSMQGKLPQADIKDTNSPLDVSGFVKMVSSNRLQYELLVAIEDSTVPGLVEGFNALGQIDNNGQITLRGGRQF